MNDIFTMPECTKCSGSGWIYYQDENGYNACKPCECMKTRKAIERIQKSGLSRQFAEKSFDNYDTQGNSQCARAKEIAMSYADSFEKIRDNTSNSMLLCGQVGAGKTHLGTATLKELIMKHGVAVLYMPYRDFITKLKQNMLESDTYEAEIKKYSGAEVLYIDDMLKGRCTESDINILYEIINYRYNNRLPLIISTEKTLKQLIEWDEAIGSRIIEMCKGHIMEFSGKEVNHRML